MATKVIVLTTPGASTWTVPADWNSGNNFVGCIGAGASGAKRAEKGGGGGAYAQKNNMILTPGASISYSIGAGGTGVSGSVTAGNTGGDTWFQTSETVLAKGGTGAGVGGLASASIGDVKYDGGSGGAGATGTQAGNKGGGGGGAAGAEGVGQTGYAHNDGTFPAKGGQGNGGVGGAGGALASAGVAGTEITSTHAADGTTVSVVSIGSGGGSGGQDGNSGNGAAPGNYGAGSGGVGGTGGTESSAAGTGGAIIISYTTVELTYARPDADISDGTWTNEVGSNVNLYASIDETSASDTDYIQSAELEAGQTDTCEINLGNVGDPSSSLDHTVRYRYQRLGALATMSLTVSLMQGATTIASWVHTNVGSSLVTAEQTLTGLQADAITDYTNLRLKFVATGS